MANQEPIRLRNMSYLYDTQFEFDEESDNVWINPTDSFRSETKKLSQPTSSRRPGIKKPLAAASTAGRSLPVNIPARDWRKMKTTTAAEGNSTGDNFEEDGEGIMGLAPHEYLARTRVASLSVHEGIGRTLKGRDLSRVRDAIWKQTGFQD